VLMSLRLNKKDTYEIEVRDTMFEIRPLALSEEERLLRKATKIKRGAEVVNNVAFLKDKFDKVVVGWNVAEINNVQNPLCDRANKDFIVEWFMSLVDEILQQADEIRDNVSAVEGENLGK